MYTNFKRVLQMLNIGTNFKHVLEMLKIRALFSEKISLIPCEQGCDMKTVLKFVKMGGLGGSIFPDSP